MSRLPHILVVAPLYAPSEGPVPAAAVRAKGLVRGLAERGYPLTLVVAMGRGQRPLDLPGAEIRTAPWIDLEGLASAAGMEGGRVVHRRVRYSHDPPILRKVATAVLPPDRYATWIPGGIRVARGYVGSETVVLSTSAKSAHIVARAIRKRRPWIADLNDLWAGDPHRRIRGRARDMVDGRLERATLTYADRLTTVNEPMREELTRRFGPKVETVYSGFDPAEFDLSARQRPEGDARVEIVFGGTLYPSLNLEPLFAAMSIGRTEGWLPKDSLRIRFIGRLTERAAAEAEGWGLSEYVEASTMIPRADLLKELVNADALLLPLYEEDPYSLPMKFFDYVGAGRPIVALGPRERLGAQLVHAHRLGTVISDRGDAVTTLTALVRGTADVATPIDRDEFTWAASIDRLETLIQAVAAR